ncbi:hypothetical protein EYF80_032124 [Liparis tanakae]|uniref:Uncharacterized protein n=1 Tax=Liparis tanakae TaxID=230148 RepID=A0A4Z2GYC8_9TELE|nr:hypothetical protein EYF80_032124 [Liparis tanakae]
MSICCGRRRQQVLLTPHRTFCCVESKTRAGGEVKRACSQLVFSSPFVDEVEYNHYAHVLC